MLLYNSIFSFTLNTKLLKTTKTTEKKKNSVKKKKKLDPSKPTSLEYKAFRWEMHGNCFKENTNFKSVYYIVITYVSA